MEEELCNTSVNYLKQLSNLTEILFSTTGNPIQNTHLRLLKKTKLTIQLIGLILISNWKSQHLTTFQIEMYFI